MSKYVELSIMYEMENIVFDKFKASLKQFKEMNIQASMNYEVWNNVFISHHSTAIEGSSLTLEEASLLLTEGITAKGKPLQHHLMLTNHHAALIFTIEYAKKNETITPEWLRHLSSLVMKDTGGVVNGMGGTYDISNGDFRLGMVRVGTRYFMDFRKIPAEVEKLCEKINTGIKQVKNVEDIYNLAFDSHFELVSIHPFGDGNGRVSRLLMNYVLEYHNQPLATIFKEDKAEYFQALELAREKDNYLFFRNFMYAQQTKFFEQEIASFKQGAKWSIPLLSAN